jgi:SNF2 family DNA or RNA helicase
MEIIDNKYIAVRTRNPDKITEVIKDAQTLRVDSDIHTVVVNWGLEEAQHLNKLKVKNVPSPIHRDYDWPGVFPPMSHQRDTAEFLTLNTRAFVFNEQGTGKTASAIWASDYLIKAGYVRRVLIVCPLSIMQAAWQADLFKFAVHRSTGIAHSSGINAAEKRAKIINGDYEYVIINYDGINIVADDIARNNFDLIIIDEANAYKTIGTKRWKLMNKLVKPTTWLWMMTGTPAAQSPFDAYGLAKLCVPHQVPRFAGAFKESVMINISRFKWVPRSDASQKIFKALQPAIRFTKKECLDLPDVTHTDREAPLTAQQKKYYELIRKEFLVISGDEEITSANAAVNLSKLLQVSCGAVYSNSKATLEFDVSNRLQVVKEVIEEASAKVLIFVPFKHAISIVKEFLTKEGIPNEIISGEVNITQRNEIFNRFQTKGDDDLKVLIIQPAAASHGVTLTAANVIIWYAPVTSTETYLQANARIDRHGQRNPMTVVHIQGSKVERDLYAMLQNRLESHEKLIDLYKRVLTE